MNILKKWREKRNQRKKLRELSRLSGVISTLDQLEHSGLLAWNAKNRQLLIDIRLAMLMMTKAEKWLAFINGVFVWTQNKRIWEAWENYLTKEELRAVREYQKRHRGKQLSRADIDRIREARRLEIASGDVEPPKVEAFEFVIIAPPKLNGAGDITSSRNNNISAKESAETSSPVGEIIAVGHYDPDTEQMEMATWSEVKNLVASKVS